MATNALVRVTGTVLALPQPRNGISQKTGKPWEIATANVLVANQNVTVVQLPSRSENGTYPSLRDGFPVVGEQVDYLVEVSLYGSQIQASVLADFPAEVSSLL